MADLVAVDVSMLTCLRQFATVANSKNNKGKAKVAICKPLPVAYKSDERNRHRFASPSNSRPILAAQPRRVTFPSASLRTQSTAAAAPTTAPQLARCSSAPSRALAACASRGGPSNSPRRGRRGSCCVPTSCRVVFLGADLDLGQVRFWWCGAASCARLDVVL